MEEKTVLLDLKLTLSDSLAREAQASGLLDPEAIETLLRAELNRRRRDMLFAAGDKLSSLDMPTMTDAEVEAEISAARNERRTRHARRS